MVKRRNLTFKKQTLFSLVLFTLCLALSSRCLFWSGDKHKVEYARILSMIESKAPKEEEQRSQVRQTRYDVYKDLLVNSKGKRLEMRINSKKSDISLASRHGKTEIVEYMEGVQCCMQEKILDVPPTQIVRRFNSKDAAYSYKKDHLVANHVDMTRTVHSGTTLHRMGKKGEPLMEGVAESVEFSPAGKKDSFKAKKLQAALHTTGRVL